MYSQTKSASLKSVLRFYKSCEYSFMTISTINQAFTSCFKCYVESRRGEFPKSLSDAALKVVGILQKNLEFDELDVSDRDLLIDRCRTFKPEASIVNYYQTKTTMGFHSDDAEFITDAPLVSISLGPPALFLLETTSPIVSEPRFPHCETLTEPGIDHILPVILEHGDVVVMAGRSRLAQHAVPHIFFENFTNSSEVQACAKRVCQRRCADLAKADPLSCHLPNSLCDKCSNFLNLLSKTRVNMNVRQVLPPNTNFSNFIISQGDKL